MGRQQVQLITALKSAIRVHRGLFENDNTGVAPQQILQTDRARRSAHRRIGGGDRPLPSRAPTAAPANARSPGPAPTLHPRSARRPCNAAAPRPANGAEAEPRTPCKASDLASWWHTAADLGRTLETFADMSKSRAAGFLDYQDSAGSFLDLFATLRVR